METNHVAKIVGKGGMYTVHVPYAHVHLPYFVVNTDRAGGAGRKIQPISFTVSVFRLAANLSQWVIV